MDDEVPAPEIPSLCHYTGRDSLPMRLQQFLCRIKEAKPFLDANGVNAQEIIWIYDIMIRVDGVFCRRFQNWFMKAAADHVVLSLHAQSTHPDDVELRDNIVDQLEQHINPAKVRFSVLLHYKD